MKAAVDGSILNLLPMPGAVIVRQTLFTGLGVSHRRVATAQLRVAGTAVAASIMVASAGLALNGSRAALFAGGAATALVLAIGRASPLALLETSFALVSALRLFVILTAFGHVAGVPDMLILAAGGPLASAVGIIPGGVGLREVFVAIIANATEVSSALAGAAAAADRAVGVGVLAIAKAVLTLGRRGRVE